MKSKDTNGACPEFHTLYIQSDQIFSELQSLVKNRDNRDLDRMRHLSAEASRIAIQLKNTLPTNTSDGSSYLGGS